MTTYKTSEATREYQRQYREAHREELREYHRQKYRANREAIAAQKREHYEAHKDDIQARNRAYYEAHRDEASERNRRYRENNPGRKLLNGAMERTRKLGLPECDLTIGYIESIIPEHCPILGIKLEVGKGRPQPNSPSLDRIEPRLGYVQGNVQVISNKANMMKQDASWDELRAFAEWVISYEYQ